MQKAQDDLNAQIDALAIAVTKNPIPPPQSSDDSSKGLSGGAIAGIVIGIVVVGAFVGYFLMNKNTSKSSSNEGVEMTSGLIFPKPR